MIYKGKCRIAEQVGNVGIYGELELTCCFTDNPNENNITLSKDLEKWRPGILFGMYYFLERIAINNGLEIILNEVDYNEVDTNNTVIAFLTVHALIKALEVQVRAVPSFDSITGSFVFPK